MEPETPNGLILSADAGFALKIRTGLASARGKAILHRFASVDEAEEQLQLHQYAYALIDARHAPLQAADMLASLLAAAPSLPVIVCLAPGEVKPPERQLRALGAFEIVSGTVWPGDHLIAALRHASWFAAAQSTGTTMPAIGVSEPDRPLLAEVSHEMRSPLNSIIGFAESIEQQALGPWPAEGDRYRDYARHIRNSGEHLLALFNDLLQIGDAALFGLEMADRIDPAELAANVTAMMQPAAAQKGLTLTCDTPAGLQPLQCNGRFLSQALLNLLQNAIKFTNDGGRVTLSIQQEGETRFTVTDTGIGFPPERLLGPRNAKAGRSPASGHGLGLRFVERVLAAHRGRLDIESRQGHGTEVTISLPAPPDAERKTGPIG
jgi:signal transduction histidine kinase